tara:strand:+ start:586 stop:1317 length:732 start_codon:yes stop_codon:yes gene_type:complete
LGYLIDYKYYKFIAIIPGWILGDFIGAIAAFLLVRELMMNKEGQVTYELALLKICSQLIKADGEVTENEIRFVRQFFQETFGSNKSDKLFKQLKTNAKLPSDINSLIRIIKEQINPTKLYAIIQFLYAISASDGKITNEENEYIYNIGFQLGFSPERLEAIKNQFVKSKSKSKKYDQKTIDCLNVLGLKGGATNGEVKAAYRSLAKEFHPDKLAGMSDGIKNLAKEKFQMIQDSYEYLNKNYV